MNRFALTILIAGPGLALAPAATAGTTIDVPGPLNFTIQEAIDIAESLGATQLNIADGVYVESLRLPDNGYDLVLMGNPAVPNAVVIEPLGLNDSAIHVLGGQTAATQIIGLTIVNGNADGLDDDGDAEADDRGGGLYVNASDVTVIDCSFLSNNASGAGGAFYVNAGSVMFDNCLFQLNGASNGGGAYLNAATATFTECIFEDNTAFTAFGGGMRTTGSTTTLTRCSFVGNSANADGGGIFQSGVGSLTIVASELVGNDANLGGGMYVAGTVDARDTIINGNIAANTGGGVYVTSSGILALVNATVVNNTGLIGGVAGAGTINVRNGIFWSNGVPLGGNPAVSYSMVEGGWVGTANINPPAGPGFMDELGSDLTLGTSDDDLTLAAGSPAIDAGDASAAVAGYPADHDGLPRAVDDPDTTDTGLAVLGLVVDMGAHEFQTAPPVVTCPGDIDGDNNVGITDFLQLLSAWGPCS